MARLKEQAVGRGGDTFFFNPEDIHEIPNYNVRDMDSVETKAHIRSMADAIIAGGTASFPPITVGQIDGKIYVYAGYCRRRAFLLAKQEGAPIKGILAVANTQTDEERTVDLLTSNNGLALTPMEKAQAVKRLVMFSWTPTEIAHRLGVSLSSINNLICLFNSPKEVQKMVSDGEVSATTAISVVRSEKSGANITPPFSLIFYLYCVFCLNAYKHTGNIVFVPLLAHRLFSAYFLAHVVRFFCCSLASKSDKSPESCFFIIKIRCKFCSISSGARLPVSSGNAFCPAIRAAWLSRT